MLHVRKAGVRSVNQLGISAVLSFGILITVSVGQPLASSPTETQIRRIVDSYFARKTGHKPGDLISQRDTKAVLAMFREKGWNVPYARELVQDTLSDSHPLVQAFRTNKGRRFMRAVAGQRLIYDRLDRVTEVSGGPAMVRQLIRLPDGARYAAWKTPRAVPDLVHLLPKTGSGKTRVVKDYRKPTDRIYTQAQLQDAIEWAYSDE